MLKYDEKLELISYVVIGGGSFVCKGDIKIDNKRNNKNAHKN